MLAEKTQPKDVKALVQSLEASRSTIIDFRTGLRGEELAVTRSLERIFTSGNFMALLQGAATAPDRKQSDLGRTLAGAQRLLLPDRLIEQDFRQAFERLARMPDRITRASAMRAEKEAFHNVRDWNLLAHLLLPALGNYSLTWARNECNQGIALGVSRIALHQKKTGKWPDSLLAIPAFKEERLLDPYTGKPFLYRKDGEGWVLYSPGEDLVDNKGAELKGRGEKSDLGYRFALPGAGKDEAF